MRRLMLSALVLVFPFVVAAQRAVVTGGVVVRESQTSRSKALARLAEGDTVSLVSAKARRGYYHVTTSDGTVGWAWDKRIEVHGADASGSSSSSSATRASSGSGAAAGGTDGGTVSSAIDPSWPRVPSNATTWTWPDGDRASCDASGKGTQGHYDPATNTFKNRTDVPASYHAVTWETVHALPVPRVQQQYRANWPSDSLKVLAQYEGLPISVVGFLSGDKQEGKESTNCGETDTARVDWHLYLNKSAGGKHSQAIVIEVTPRVRPSHAGWTLSQLAAYAKAGDTLRISGWLMYDPEHYVQMWKFGGVGDTTGVKARITLWEIHPITKIEVRKNHAWVDLDSRP